MPARTASSSATTEFLRRFAPYNRMADSALALVAARVQLVHFAKNDRLLTTDDGPVTHLFIVRRGLVGSRPNRADADPDRTLGPGEPFPVGALSAGSTTTKVFFALRDTYCYLLPRDDFLELRRISPEFELYCTQTITETLKQSLESLHGEYRQRVAEQQSAVADAGRARTSRARLLSGRGNAARGRADDGRRQRAQHHRARRPRRPVGMFTLVDLLQAGRAARRARSMGRSPTIDDAADRHAAGVGDRLRGDARDGRARHAPGRRGANGAACGRRERARPLRAAAGVDAPGERGPARGRQRRPAEARRRRHSPADPEPARAGRGRRGGHADDRRAQRRAVAPCDRARAGAVTISPDFDWCWLALGSEGRGEQTFATDQDNALCSRPAIAAQTARVGARG